MRAIERAGYLAHARTAGFARRLAEARESIREMLSRCRRPFVGFSAGKDSACVLWLVWEQAPAVPGWCLTGGETRLLYGDFDQVWTWWQGHGPVEEVLIDRVFSPGWEEADWWTQYQAVEGPAGQWSTHLHTREIDGVFLGLRMGESTRRGIALARFRDGRWPIYRYGDGDAARAGHLRCCPIEHWTEDDVGALHALRGIPLLAAYAEGMEARTHLRIGRTSLRMGQLGELRRRDPEGYRRVIARFPELAREYGG